METTTDPTRVIHAGRPHWRWPDGTLLPVITGGDGPDDPPDDDDDDVKALRAELASLKTDVEKWRKHSRKHEDENKRLRADLAKATGGDQPDPEKLAAAERRAEEAELRAMRMEVAADKGLSAKQAKRLQGATREELESDADELLADFKPATGKTTEDKDDETDPAGGDTSTGPGRKPAVDLKGGGNPATEPPEETDPRKIAEKVGRF